MRLSFPQSQVYQNEARFRVLVAGRRFGKTFLAGPELYRMVSGGRDRVAWYLAPTYRQAKQVAWRELKSYFRPYLANKPNETDLSLNLRNGSMIALRGADNYDSLRGPGLDGVVLDEFADMAPEAWTEVLRPALSDRQGRALFIGTPKGYNHFHDIYQEAGGSNGWARFQYTTLDGGNVTAEEIESSRRDMDEKTFRQEYQASFENFEGRAYYAFDRNANVTTDAEYHPALPICWALDFNVNPMCSILCQVEETTTRVGAMVGRREYRVNVFDEIHIANSNTPEACEEFARRVDAISRRGQPTIYVYGDASGSARHTAAGAGANSDWAVIREFFRNQRYQVAFRYKASNPAVRDRVAAMNAMLCNAQGERRLFVHPRCKYLTKDLEQVAWKPATKILDQASDPMLTHISDALGYLIESEMPLRQSGTAGYQPGRII